MISETLAATVFGGLVAYYIGGSTGVVVFAIGCLVFQALLKRSSSWEAPSNK